MSLASAENSSYPKYLSLGEKMRKTMRHKCILWSKWAAVGSNGFEEYIITWVSLKSSKKERIKRDIKCTHILSTV